MKAYRDEIDALKSKVSWCLMRFNFLSCNQVHKVYFDIWGSKGGTLTRALASHPCVQGSSPTSSATCSCSFLLLFPVLLHGFYHAPLVFFGVKNSAFKIPLPLGIIR